MKKRSENCWLMQSRITAAVATTSAQRQPPRKLRTRVTSASCMLAWGSSNTTLLGVVAALSATDMIDPPSRGAGGADVLLIEPVRHAGLRQCRPACLHPAFEEGLFVRRRIALGVVRPGGDQHFLTLEQRVVVGFLLGGPVTRFLQRLHCAGMDRNHPVLGLLRGIEAGRTRRGV